MHPIDKIFFELLGEVNPSLVHTTTRQKGEYSISLPIPNILDSRISAVRFVETLRKAKLLGGAASPVSAKDIHTINDTLSLGENARLRTTAESPETLLLDLTFTGMKPADVHRKIKIIGKYIEGVEAKPSVLAPAKHAIESVFRAAGLSPVSVQAVHNDFHITFGTEELPSRRIGEISKSLYDAGLLQPKKAAASPSMYLDDQQRQCMHLPFPGKSLSSIQNGLFIAEILLRKEAEKTFPWLEKITKSTFVSGGDKRMQ